MDATNPMTPQNQQKREDSRRKRKAILAGGVVLGLGAAVTLAAWSDDVFANGTFNTGGKFTIEGATGPLGAPGTFERAPDSDEALTLVFSAEELSPGETAYAPFTIKTTDDSTLIGNLTQVSSTVNTGAGMADALEYSISSGATDCTEATHNGTPWIAATAVNSATDPTATDVPLAANGNAAVGLCIAVTFPEDAKDEVVTDGTEVADTIVTWQFHAEQTP